MKVEQIGRYEIRRELGRGGMATVYLAYDPHIQRQVAVKVLPRQFTHDPKYLSRFQQEAQVIAQLEHPAIVPIYDFGEENDAPYLVMRYMAGGSLRDRMNGKPQPLDEVALIFNRLSQALDHAHDLGIIHRDLKPSNILFDDQENAYLADFGIAQIAGKTLSTTGVIGTPAYMSPEQIIGKVKLDGRSDIYTLGTILYQLLAGKTPYDADTTGQMYAHVHEPVPAIQEVNPDLPPGTQQVIEKAMAKDREERYQSASELATAVTDLLTGEAAAPADVAVAATAVKAAELRHEPEVAEPPGEIESQFEAALEDGAEKVYLVTPPETAAESLQRAETTPVAAVTGGGSAGPSFDAGGKSGSLPNWVWWVGALAFLVVIAFSIRAVLDGGTEEMPAEEEALAEEPAKEIPTEVEAPVAEDAAANADLPPSDATLGDIWVRPFDGMAMVYVPEGSFPMGSEDGADDASPVHEVTLDAFWIDRTEVTIDQFAKFVASTGYETTAEEEGSGWVVTGEKWEDLEGANWQHPKGPDSDLADLAGHPVVLVSWNDAEAYCLWAGGRLPTEAEWEYAARGPEGNEYPWGDEAPNCDLVQFVECRDGTIQAGALLDGASWVGTLDMSGNVWEWVNDWYGNDYYANSPADNPQGPESDSIKVMRGGSWYNESFPIRGATRYYNSPDSRDVSSGFRCVLSSGE